VLIDPVPELRGLEILERGEVRMQARAVVANLPRMIAERELKVLKRELRLDSSELEIEEIRSPAPGNIAQVEVQSAQVTEVITGFGEVKVRSEVVGTRLVEEVKRYLQANVPVGEHLADQLLLPLALAGSGSYLTMPLSMHALTNIEVIKLFLPIQITSTATESGATHVQIRS
jgi:RNA 3'-terminal phosphate cyclase (ATP)